MRCCTRCLQNKALDQFYTYFSVKRNKVQTVAKCIPCKAVCDRESIERHRDRKRRNSNSWRNANRDKANLSVRKWMEVNRPRVRAYVAKHRAAKLQQTPRWANSLAIVEFYSKCPDGYHVDHIIPLQGELVSGLHILENLQYLPAGKNIGKSNRIDLSMYEGIGAVCYL